MDDKIIAMYCLCDDLLKALHHHEDTQRQMTDAEVMTTALVAALFLRGHHESARMLCQERIGKTNGIFAPPPLPPVAPPGGSKRCGTCGSANRADAKFCTSCGVPM